MKSHFADEERLRGRRENSGEKRLGTNTYLGSLTSKTKRDFGEKTLGKRRENLGNLADEERLRERRETSRTS